MPAKWILPFLVLISLCNVPLSAQNATSRNEVKRETRRKGGKTLTLTLIDKTYQEPLIMANCQLLPIGAYAATNMEGRAVFENIPEGEWQLEISYVGYESVKKTVNVQGDTQLKVEMQQQNLALQDVEVVARQNTTGEATSSIIGRQAIDHLQANSLADIMQLIPGQLMTNSDLTSQSNLQLRTLVNNNTSAFGSSVVMDGVPMSNNGSPTQGGFSSTAFVGTDLRQISADDIQEVEVVRGIPSAEYGDLTSGMMVVKTKVGVTPWQLKAKINPGTQNYSVGKGLKLDKYGTLNFNFDYAKAWGDPRQKTRSFDRYTGSIGWSKDITRKWDMTTKVRFSLGKDWSGNDPDAIDDGTSSRNDNRVISLNHNGNIHLNKKFARALRYTFGLSFTESTSRNTSYVSNSSGLLPILTARESGYYSVPWETTSYLATGRTESKPGNLFFKVSNSFFIKAGPTKQNFKMGVEYKFDWNEGKGYYNDDDRHPYRPNSSGRPRAFSDIPSLHQLSAYAEDNFRWELNKVNILKLQAGVRFSGQQMLKDESTFALSPRLNASFAATKWLEIRGGYGLNSKTPGMNYLYPDKKYADIVAANYMPQDGSEQILIYQTQMYEVNRNKHLKNATTTKIEAGVDIKLPWSGKLSLLGYIDKTPKGFGTLTDYVTYTNSLYAQDQIDALIAAGNSAANSNVSIPVASPVNPTLTHTYFMTTGKVGNTSSTKNQGIEMDFDLGEIKALHTSFYVSGAYSETKTWNKDLETANVRTALLTTDYTSYGLTPFKVVYPSGLDYSKYRRFMNTLRTVTHIPALKMVASLTAQAVWFDWNHSYTADKQAIGWITDDGTGSGNTVYHAISSDMRNGYISYAGAYSDTDNTGIKISDLDLTYTDKEPTKNPVTWNMQARLTKELGKFGGFSCFVNNCLFYEPFKSSNKTSTRTQRNTSSFQFGCEIYFNL
ncbi:MAG: TonB-dependent receptor plug domain-containing protein [Bacteroidales bacterium]|nr:TonB-dependent receptor plug domain-containing protein [Bacteroidales bacterium]